MQARNRIEARDFGEMDDLGEGMFNLFMLAYEDKRQAEDARLQYLQALVRAQCNAAKET